MNVVGSIKDKTMDQQLQRLIELSRKTGDRLIVFDPSHKQSTYVVMEVDDYEKLAIGRSEVRGLTEEELLDKINRDVSIWKSDKLDNDVFANAGKDDEGYFPQDTDIEDDFYQDKDTQDEDWYRVDEIAQNADYIEDKSIENESKKNKTWSIPSDRKKKAEEIIEEDRYYLEDIED